MDFQYAVPLGSNFLEFLHALEEMDRSDDPLSQIEQSAVRKEVHEIQPVVFGGSPADDKKHS
jgi:hypothetical protein